MKQHKRAHSPREAAVRDGRWAILSAAFLLGAAGGSLLCARWERLLSLAERYADPPGLWSALWPELVPAALLLLLGIVGKHGTSVLLLSVVKGFTLSSRWTAVFAVSAGSEAAGAAMARLVPEMLSLGAFLLLARHSLTLCVRRGMPGTGRGRGPLPDGTFWLTAVTAGLLTLLSAVLTVRCVPGAAAWACARLSALQ